MIGESLYSWFLGRKGGGCGGLLTLPVPSNVHRADRLQQQWHRQSALCREKSFKACIIYFKKPKDIQESLRSQKYHFSLHCTEGIKFSILIHSNSCLTTAQPDIKNIIYKWTLNMSNIRQSALYHWSSLETLKINKIKL